MVMTSAQCRAARALVNWTQQELEVAASVAKKTIADFEADRRRPYERTLAALRSALEAAGVQFIEQNGGGAGVRLRRPAAPEASNP
jgi:transcriptional regulator with XRE-family HTH domain